MDRAKVKLFQVSIFFPWSELFAWATVLLKKLEINKSNLTIALSTFKIDITIVGLLLSISNLFTNKTAQANKLVYGKRYLCI